MNQEFPDSECARVQFHVNTQLTDTHFKVEKVLISLLREKSRAEKFSLVRSLSQVTIQLSKRAIQRANKGIDEDQTNLIFVDLHYGAELCRKFQKYLSQQHDNT